MKTTEHKRLRGFLYLLMRDKLPTADVASVVKSIENVDGEDVFTAKGLAGYADELAGRILGTPSEVVAQPESISIGESVADVGAGWINVMREGRDIGKKLVNIVRVYNVETGKPMAPPWVLPVILAALARRFAKDPQFMEELHRLGLRLEVDG